MSSSISIQTMQAMIKAVVDSATSEATGYPKEQLVDNNPDTYWKPTSTANQDIEIDLQIGGTIITNQADRDFNVTAPNWVNVDLFAFSDTTDLTIASSAVGQYCKLQAAGLDQGFEKGHTYRITYDYTESVTGFQFKTDTETIGAAVAGTKQTLTWIATDDGTELRIESTGEFATGDFDNFQICEIFDELTINCWRLLLHNYTTDHGPDANPRLNVYYSDDDVEYTAWDTGTFDGTWQTTVGRQILLGANHSDDQHRYWRFSLSSMATTIEISGLFLCRTTIFSQGNQFPEKDGIDYFTKVKNQPGGLTRVQRINTNPVYTRPRNWIFITDADIDALRDVYNQSLGYVLPLIIREDTEDAEFVYIKDRRFNRRDIAHAMAKPSITLETIPMIYPGRDR